MWLCRCCGHHDASHLVSTGEVVNEDPARPPAARPSLLIRDQLRIVRPYLAKHGVVIDIGCSGGAFLRHALNELEAGDASYGIEISEPNRQAAERSGVRVLPSLGEVPSGSVVTMWHSAEHFPISDLQEMLRSVRTAADDTVRLIVSVPNGQSIQSRCFGERWTYHDPMAHFSVFSPQSLRLCVEATGWTLHASQRTPVYGLFGAVQSSINLLRPRNELYLALKRGEGRLGPAALVLSVLAAAVTAPISATMTLAETSRALASVLTYVFAPK